MNKAEMLKVYPHIPSDLDLTSFLWDDPLFNPEAHTLLDYGKDDPEWLAEKRREMTLDTLNLMYRRIDVLEERVAEATWIWHRLYEHVPTPSVRVQILMDARIAKTLDPAFSFRDAIAPKVRSGPDIEDME